MKFKCLYIIGFWISAAVSVGFAENFQDRPTLSELNETVEQAITCGNAVIERDAVVNRNQNFMPYCGHWPDYFASLQYELEYYLPQLYVDHANGPLTTNHAAFLYFTVATWREAAGLNTNGFRRATEQGGGFSYGHAQAGDIIGSWIYEDLQNGYSTLQQVVWANYTVEYKRKYVMTGQQSQTPEQLQQLCVNMWDEASWQSCGYVAARAEANGSFSFNTNFNESSGNAEAYRDAWKVTLLFPTNCVERSVDEYFQPQVYETFYDIDDMGLEGQGILTKIQEFGMFSESSKELEWVGEGDDVCPWALIEEEPGCGSYDYAYRGGTAYIVKPNFQYKGP